MCVVVTETELEEKNIPLLVLFFVKRIPVHSFVHRALIVQITWLDSTTLFNYKGVGRGCQLQVVV